MALETFEGFGGSTGGEEGSYNNFDPNALSPLTRPSAADELYIRKKRKESEHRRHPPQAAKHSTDLMMLLMMGRNNAPIHHPLAVSAVAWHLSDLDDASGIRANAKGATKENSLPTRFARSIWHQGQRRRRRRPAQRQRALAPPHQHHRQVVHRLPLGLQSEPGLRSRKQARSQPCLWKTLMALPLPTLGRDALLLALARGPSGSSGSGQAPKRHASVSNSTRKRATTTAPSVEASTLLAQQTTARLSVRGKSGLARRSRPQRVRQGEIARVRQNRRRSTALETTAQGALICKGTA